MKHTPGPVGPRQSDVGTGAALASDPEPPTRGAGGDPVSTPLPAPAADPERCTIESPHPPAKVIDILGRESKRGRLAGFRIIESAKGNGPGAYVVTAFGGIYDYDLIARVSPRGTEDAGSRTSFEMRLQRKMPIAAVAIIVFTIFPGLQLTDSMLASYFSWYTIETWWWYLPLVGLMIPFMWRQFKAGRAEARRDAITTIEKIGTLVAKG